VKRRKTCRHQETKKEEHPQCLEARQARKLRRRDPGQLVVSKIPGTRTHNEKSAGNTNAFPFLGRAYRVSRACRSANRVGGSVVRLLLSRYLNKKISKQRRPKTAPRKNTQVLHAGQSLERFTGNRGDLVAVQGQVLQGKEAREQSGSDARQ
jgi:hypothetical protein